jgi:AcrR family transcriptional regulator
MATVTALPRARRTQEERSAATRARLLDATVACLDELGYARTTTPEIARRAGLSRGAQLHHFPSKQELVTSAVQHLFARRHQEFLDAFARLPAGADRYAAAIDLLWSMMRGPTFTASIELAIAARTDPELRARFAELTAELRRMIEGTFRALFPAATPPGPFFDVAPRFTFALLEGLALHRLQVGDGPEVSEVVDALKALAALLMPKTSD